jgi:hypothetical protein
MVSEKEIGFYRGYALYCDEDGDFSAKKTDEAREYQDYEELDDLKKDIRANVTEQTSNSDFLVIGLLVGVILGLVLGVIFVNAPVREKDGLISSLNSSLNKCLEQKQESLTMTREEANCLFRTEKDSFSVTMIDSCMSDCDRQYGPTAVMLCQKGCKKK